MLYLPVEGLFSWSWVKSWENKGKILGFVHSFQSPCIFPLYLLPNQRRVFRWGYVRISMHVWKYSFWRTRSETPAVGTQRRNAFLHLFFFFPHMLLLLYSHSCVSFSLVLTLEVTAHGQYRRCYCWRTNHYICHHYTTFVFILVSVK